MNRQAEQTFSSAHITVQWPLTIEQGLHGAHIGIDIPRPRLCRVTCGTTDETAKLPRYTVIPVYEQFIEANDATRARPFVKDSPEPTFYAYEVNSNPSVPIDGTAVVWCWLSEFTGKWTFDYEYRMVYAKVGVLNGATGGDPYGYSWVEQMPQEDGAWADRPDGYSGSHNGTVTYNPLYELNRSISVPEDTIVIANRSYSQCRAEVVITRIQAGLPPALREIQSIKVLRAIGGTFTLTFTYLQSTYTTGNIAWNANAAAVQAALEAITVPGAGGVTVSGAGTEASPFIVTFIFDFNPWPLLIADFSLLKNTQEWVFSFGGESSFLAVLIAKSYEGTTPIYSWLGVDQEPLAPLMYYPNGTHGEPGNFPAYHINNIDIVVSPEAAAEDPLSNVSENCVVRMWRGAGDYYLFEPMPRWEFGRKTSATSTEINGMQVFTGKRVRWDQTTKAVVDVVDIYMINLGAEE